MNKIMKLFILTICFFYFQYISYAQPEAEFIRVSRNYTYNPDGSMEMRYSKALKLNTHIAFNNLYGETFIIYNPAFQTLTINESYTKQADGTIIKTPTNAFNEVLPSAASHAPVYNSIKEMVVTHTGLELGATIYLDYTIHNKPQSYNAIDICESIQELCPIREYDLTVQVPAGKALYYTLNQLTGQLNTKEENGIKSYHWIFRDIPAASQEPLQPRYGSSKPRFTATENPEGMTVMTALCDLLKQPTTPDIEALAKRLAQESKNPREALFHMQEYVVKQIQNVNIPFSVTGYRIRSPHELLQSAYGTPYEKTALLASMLESIGMRAELAAVFPGDLKNKPKGLNTVQEVLLAISYEGETIFLSATQLPREAMEWRADRDEILVSNGVNSRLWKEEEESKGVNIVCDANIKISDGKVKTTGNAQVTGSLPKISKARNESIARRLSSPFGTSIKEDSITIGNSSQQNHFITEVSYKFHTAYYLFDLPETENGVKSFGIAKLNSTRKTALELPHRLSEEYDYLVELDGVNYKGKELNLAMTNEVGSVSVCIQKEEKGLHVTRTLRIDKTAIKPQEYKQLRELMAVWYNPNGKKILLKE